MRSAAACAGRLARPLSSVANTSQSRPSTLSRRQNALHQRHPSLGPAGTGKRTIFIQTEATPNADALKFLPNHRVLPEGFSAPFVEYLNPRSTIAPPYPSQLAAKLMNIDGVTSVFYGADFITITKAGDANWAHIRPEIFALITEAITSGETIVTVKEASTPEEAAAAGAEEDSLAYNEDDDEVVGMIKELLETRIRPAIQEDGGDIEFRGFDDGYVKLKLRGACRTCDSSTVTLKNGIEGMLMHYVSTFLMYLWSNFMSISNMVHCRLKKSRVYNRFWTRRRKFHCRNLPSLRRSSSSKRAWPRYKNWKLPDILGIACVHY